MQFKDRQAAGRELAQALKAFDKSFNTLVIALPRGGVVVGFEVASALSLPLDIIAPRKIGAPSNPELAIGAITETGEGIFSQELIRELNIPSAIIHKEVEREKKEAKRRLDYYRKDRSTRNLKGKRVILIDDGIATGSTMLAAIKTAKVEEAAEIIIAVPVAPPDTLARLKKEVTQIICLVSPVYFLAVGQFYEHFNQTTDEEVIALLETSNSAY